LSPENSDKDDGQDDRRSRCSPRGHAQRQGAIYHGSAAIACILSVMCVPAECGIQVSASVSGLTSEATQRMTNRCLGFDADNFLGCSAGEMSQIVLVPRATAGHGPMSRLFIRQGWVQRGMHAPREIWKNRLWAVERAAAWGRFEVIKFGQRMRNKPGTG